MKLKPALAAILSATALLGSSGAHALVFEIGSLPIIPNPGYINTTSVAAGNFFDRYNFVFPAGVGQAQASTTFALTPGIQNMVVQLFNGTTNQLLGTGTQLSGFTTLLTNGMVAGQSYYYNVTGTANAPGQQYTFTAQAVPEPGTYVLFLAGLTAVGWIARRRRVA